MRSIGSITLLLALLCVSCATGGQARASYSQQQQEGALRSALVQASVQVDPDLFSRIPVESYLGDQAKAMAEHSEIPLIRDRLESWKTAMAELFRQAAVQSKIQVEEYASSLVIEDPDKLMEGAADMRQTCLNKDFAENDSLKYAAIRNILLRKGKSVEILCNYEPSLHYVSEWWKQLFGESEGKDQKGLFPASVDLTTDLHSMGQFIQDGSRIMFETVMELENPSLDVTINEEPVDLDGLNYLSGKTLDFINKSAMKGTQLAHTDGNVPNLSVKLPKQDEFSLGQLFYFFEFACGVSGYILGVNPFNQPGVESYKANMFALLGKPGYEAQREELMKRL